MLSASLAYGKCDSVAFAEAVEDFHEKVLHAATAIHYQYQQKFEAARNAFKEAETKAQTLAAIDEMRTTAAIVDTLDAEIAGLSQKYMDAKLKREEEQRITPLDDTEFFA